MSIEAVAWALRVPVGGSRKVVLIGLANHAHPDGTDAYPSLDTLATYAHCERSTARRAVNSLEAAGWIVAAGTGPHGTRRFRLRLDRREHEPPPREGGGKTPPVDGTPMAPATGGGSTGARRGVAPTPPEPSIEPSMEERTARANARTGPNGAPALSSSEGTAIAAWSRVAADAVATIRAAGQDPGRWATHLASVTPLSLGPDGLRLDVAPHARHEVTRHLGILLGDSARRVGLAGVAFAPPPSGKRPR